MFAKSESKVGPAIFALLSSVRPSLHDAHRPGVLTLQVRLSIKSCWNSLVKNSTR